jgi:glycosyltransferase involved in cell wall biosynthesis
VASITPLVLSPTVFLALIGKLRGGDRTRPTPNFGWKDSVVDVVVPARNEEDLIALCLTSLVEQDFPVRKITVIDDASTDRTAAVVQRFQQLGGRAIELLRRDHSVGKTPSLREVCRQSDADAIVVVDADTILSDRSYISRIVEELFRNPGVASACGEVMPLGRRRRRTLVRMDERLRLISSEFALHVGRRREAWGALLEEITYIYRSALYLFLQRFLYDGHLKLFGSRLNPIGCAVAYRASRLRECFDYAQPRMGDNLSTSEDIFIGHFFTWKGWRNVQVTGIRCESLEPPVNRLPRQLYLWSSAFLQAQYYFRDLPLSLFKQLKRLFRRGHVPPGGERREIREQYRAPWGEGYTHRFGRPVGLVDFFSVFEKASYPLVLLYLAIFAPEWALLTIGVETGLATLSVFALAQGTDRLRSAAMMLAATPIRVLSLGVDLISVLKYLLDLAIGNRKWRK